MKKILFAALVAIGSFASISAHAEGAYAGLSVERSNYSLEVTGATTSSSSGRPTGFKIFGGYDFTSNLGVEAGYASLGTSKANFSVLTTPGSIESKNSSFYVAGKGTYAINEQFSTFGKLGFARNKSEFSGTGLGTSFNGNTNKTDLYAAIGVAYHFNKNLAAILEYERFGKFNGVKNTGSANANVLSAGVRFNF